MSKNDTRFLAAPECSGNIRMLEFWTGLKKQGAYPRYSGFRPHDHVNFYESMWVTERLPDGDFVARYFGIHAAQAVGGDFTGIPVSSYPPEAAAKWRTVLKTCFSESRPFIYQTKLSEFDRRFVLVECISMPFVRSGKVPDILVSHFESIG